LAAPHEAFAGRLRKALDAINFPSDRARAGALADKYAVSRETTRKWLLGLALPELPRIIEIAQDTGASFEWLATGRYDTLPQTPPASQGVAESQFTAYADQGLELQLLQAFRSMPLKKQKALVELLTT
jgi:transcriptional regulator with XRE-family HTH domain